MPVVLVLVNLEKRNKHETQGSEIPHRKVHSLALRAWIKRCIKRHPNIFPIISGYDNPIERPTGGVRQVKREAKLKGTLPAVHPEQPWHRLCW